MEAALPVERTRKEIYINAALVFLAMLALTALLAWINAVNFSWLSPKFEQRSTITAWGIIQRLYLIIPGVLIVLWKPGQIGFRVGKIFKYWRMLLVMLVLNVGVTTAYLFLTGATPYSGADMVFNETVTVPLVEEVVWRGIIFAAAQAVLAGFLDEGKSAMLAGVFSGICFGLLHSTNLLYGVPFAFVAIQVLNATVWGVVYGIARAKTGSVYPSIVMHAAMNLAVALA